MRMYAGVVAAFLVSFAVPVPAQQPAAPQPRPAPRMPGMPGVPRDGQPAEKIGTAQLTGRVVAADTGKPLRRALVRASSQDLPQGRTVSTDADGRWSLKELPAGSYMLRVEKGGYVGIAYGQRRPFAQGTILELVDGQVMANLDVALPRAGVITGVITDEFGEPASNVQVMALRQRYMNGQRRLVPIGPRDMTDDIGQYRLHGLSPGEYYVAASAPGIMMLGASDDRTGYAQTFYPGTPAHDEAQRVQVALGQETPLISFSMAMTRVATISGTARNASGTPISRGMISLFTRAESGMMSGVGTAIKPDGSFTFANVAPGRYEVRVQYSRVEDAAGGMGMPGGPGMEYASIPLTISGADVTGLELVTSPGGTVRGRVVFEGGRVPASLSPASLQLFTAGSDPGAMMPGGPPGRVRDDWTFEVTGASDTRRLRVGGLPPAWVLKAVTHNGLDVTDSGVEFRDGQTTSDVEMVLTDRATDLSGTVQDPRGKPSTDYIVVAFASDSSRWGYGTRFVRSVRPNQEGRFSLKGLPAGEYLAVALDYLEPGEEADPELLEAWRPSATRVTLEDGAQKTVMLTINSQ